MTYDRPNQPWICGHTGEGNPCPFGPNRLGLCQRTGDCIPIESNGHWQCNRSKLHGGPCAHGPTVDGECGIHRERCVPTPSLRKRRGMFVVCCIAIAIALIAILPATPWRTEVLSPGSLTQAHAHIATRGVGTNNCSACHAAGNESLADWLVPATWRHANGNEPASQSQSNLCLHCHDNSFDRLTALNPHGISVAELQRLSKEASQRADLRTVSNQFTNGATEHACATCHNEHHGATHNISALTNKQCATCHTEHFYQFSKHPDFKQWPHRRPTRITFDHVSHQFQHFPKDGAAFACNACHVENEGQQITSVDGFASCKSCHESGIMSPTSDGISFFSLPSLDMDAFVRAGINVGTWPTSATQEFDGELTPFMRMMLESDPKASAALAEFEAPFDFLDVDPSNRQHLIHAAQIVFAIKRLMQRLAFPNLDQADERDISAAALNPIESKIPPFVIEAAVEKWMRPTNRTRQAGHVEDSEPILAGKRQWQVKQANYLQSSSNGGWFRDDDGLTIGYRPQRHDDPVMVALYTTLAKSSNRLGEGARKLFSDLRQTTATGQCASCHSMDHIGTRHSVNWLASQPDGTKHFTKFSHTPHLIQAELRDCATCHVLNTQLDKAATSTTRDLVQHIGDFQNIDKKTCVSCHSPNAAGDSCMTCHNYHIDSPDSASELSVAERNSHVSH